MKILMITPYVTITSRPEFCRNITGFGYMVYDIAKAVAKALEIDYIDTGAMYRALGYKLATKGIKPKIFMVTIKPPKTFRIICPTDMLTAKRIVRLKGFESSDIISSGTIKGAIATGTPSGKKVRK